MLILNDIHFNPNYTRPDGRFGKYTDMGMYHEYMGSPIGLVELIVNNAYEELEGRKLDAVIMTGDFIYHGFE